MDDAKAVESDAEARHPNHGEPDSRQQEMPGKGTRTLRPESCRVSTRVSA